MSIRVVPNANIGVLASADPCDESAVLDAQQLRMVLDRHSKFIGGCRHCCVRGFDT